MSLAARVSAFFLATLALVLAGVSVTLYLLSSAHLHRDLDERLGLALDSIATLVDVDPGRVDWNPGGQSRSLVADAGDEPVFWMVTDSRGAAVDRTWEVEPHDLAAVAKLSPETGHSHETFVDLSGRRWRVTLRRIHAGPPARGALVSSSGTAPEEAENQPRSLVIMTAASLSPMEKSLRNVGLILAGLSVGFWLLAAAVGWWLCRRALLPVARMAKAAGSMSMADRDQRLPIPGTGDELDLLAGSFNGLLDRLHQAFERQKRFTGDASHQLRTPLAALLGQLEVARRRERSVCEYRRVLDEVYCEASRLRQIVESLLFMARAESEAGSPELEPIELVLWVRERLASRADDERAPDFHELLLDSRPGLGASAPAATGTVARQFAGQRLQVQSARDASDSRSWQRWPRGDAGGARPGHGHRRRRLAAHFRALLSLVEIPQAARRRAWPGCCRADSPGLRGNDACGKHARARKRVHRTASGRDAIDRIARPVEVRRNRRGSPGKPRRFDQSSTLTSAAFKAATCDFLVSSEIGLPAKYRCK